MVAGELTTPDAEAVTVATPAGPGVQVIGFSNESQVPAQARPPFEMVNTAVLLEL